MSLRDKFLEIFGLQVKQEEQAPRTSRGVQSTYGDFYTDTLRKENLSDYIEAYHTHCWVYAAVFAIATSGAGVKFKIYRNSGGERKEVDRKDLPSVFIKPNPFYSFYDLVEATLAYAELTGLAFWELVKSGKDLTAIYPLRSDKMEIIPDPTHLIRNFKYTPNYKSILFEPEDIMMVKYFSPLSELRGLGSVEPVALSITIDLLAQKFNKQFFKQGAKLSGVLETEQTIDDVTFERIKEDFRMQFTGEMGAHRVPILEKGLKWHEISLAPKDMEFIEGRRVNREEILAAFGVPPIMVGILEGATYANAYEQKKTFWQETMLPKMKKLEEQINSTILPSIDRELEGEFDFSDVEALQENEEMRSKIDISMVQNGVFTINEVRKKRNLPEVAWGNEYYISAGVIPVSEVSITASASEVEKTQFTEIEKAKWRAFAARVRNWENRLFERLKSIFAEEESKYLKRLDSLLVEKAGKPRPSAPESEMESQLWPEDFADNLRKKFKPLFQEMIKENGQASLTELKSKIDFNIADPKTETFLRTKNFKFSDEVANTTKKLLGRTLAEGFQAGESPEKLRRRVQEVFNRTARGSAPRARVIARTEVVSASNFGVEEGWKQSGIIKKKQWLAALDENTRTEHAQAHGQTVGIDEPFVVGGESLDYPGDPSGSPGNIINCRCSMVSVIE